jgi:capsular exopolysaccharide synthesis family protein
VSIHDYLKLLRKRWITILVVTLIGIGGAAAYVKSQTKIYTASAQIFVAASSADDTNSLNNGNTFAEARVQSYTTVANSPAITTAVIATLKKKAAQGNRPPPNLSAQQLADKITADAPQNKVVLNIHVTDESAVQAASLANTVATQLVTYIEDIEKISAGSAESPVRLTVTHPATVPGSPTSPKTTLNLIIGLLAGLLIGLGLAILRETLDTRVRTTTDVAETSGAAILAAVPSDKKTAANPVAGRGSDYSPRAESYRQLRANLQYIAVDHPPRVIAVSSAVSGEGKSVTAINLATTLADAGLRVFLVDADLRRPSVARYLGLPNGAGLTSILAGKAQVADVMQPVGGNLVVIASGPIPPNPAELLASTQFRNLLRELQDMVDYVVIDSAPLLPVADGREVGVAADICLLVTQAGRTNRDQLKQAVAALHGVDAKLGGVVINMVSSRDSGTYYDYYTEERTGRKSTSKA